MSTHHNINREIPGEIIRLTTLSGSSRSGHHFNAAAGQLSCIQPSALTKPLLAPPVPALGVQRPCARIVEYGPIPFSRPRHIGIVVHPHGPVQRPMPIIRRHAPLPGPIPIRVT